ncbi:unnamed protein product, partial [Prorocentrum cordatum]
GRLTSPDEMGCGMVSQRGASVEVHHPLAHDAASRAAGARVVTAGSEASGGGHPPQE